MSSILSRLIFFIFTVRYLSCKSRGFQDKESKHILLYAPTVHHENSATYNPKFMDYFKSTNALICNLIIICELISLCSPSTTPCSLQDSFKYLIILVLSAISQGLLPQFHQNCKEFGGSRFPVRSDERVLKPQIPGPVLVVQPVLS
jgi:hypothetical protein